MNNNTTAPVLFLKNCSDYNVSTWNNNLTDKPFMCETGIVKDCKVNENGLTKDCTVIQPSFITMGSSITYGNATQITITKDSSFGGNNRTESANHVFNGIPLGNYKDNDGITYKAIRIFEG